MNINEKEILFKKFEPIKCFKKDEYSAVYLANHIFLEKQVFLKILDTHTIPDVDIIERFKREAKILAKLDHPNIIKVYDFGTSKDFFYISFEYFNSKNLRELLKEESIDDNTKKAIVIQILKGLDCVHKNKILHRDIKPENILINDNLEVKITDFGLAQISQDQLITQKYSVVGTPAYMSPEQIQGDRLSVKSDLFSLGITIFELYSGVNPFLGKDSNQTINNIISFEERKIHSQFENFPQEIVELLKGLLVAKPEKRYESIGKMLSLLGINQLDQKSPTSKRKNIKFLIPIISLIVLSGLLYLIFDFTGDDRLIDPQTDQYNNQDTISDFISKPNEIIESEAERESEFEISRILNEKNNNQEIIREENLDTSIRNDLPMPLLEGELYIKCYPWADIHLNNTFLETTPLSKSIKMTPGKYLVSLTHPDYPVYRDSITINPSELFTLEINLDTLFGFLYCQVYPWGEIVIDGQTKGITPLEYPITLNPGSYKLELKNPSYGTKTSTIYITRHDTLKLKFNMGEEIIN